DLAEAFTLYSKTKELTKHIKPYHTEGGESVNMCKAIDDMVKDGEARGEYNAIIKLLKDNIISLSDAAKYLNLSESELLEQLN
ncbi:MAG: hypothetical protein IJ648_05600, partial [Lachnospiraceae bacterium]|nr:hypothetical protein [Lachnospiraceae bacterium]